MAYRFATDAHCVEFDKAPFNGYTLGGYTVAMLVKRNTLATVQRALFVSDLSFPWFSLSFAASNAAALDCHDTGQHTAVGPVLSSTSLWYLIVVTGNGTANPRWHFHDGTSWTHTVGTAGGGVTAFGSTHRVFVSPSIAWGGEYLKADVVCIGFKKSDSSDATVQTLSQTLFSAWQSFGFDWLVGFDAAGARSNQGSSSGGGEIARTGTSLVADPPGWTWVAAVTPVADFTGTPTSGIAPLAVTFTDASTNTPTSWLWDFGDGATSTSQNPTHSYTVSGVYTVSLTATNTGGSNTKTRTAYITVGETVRYATSDYGGTLSGGVVATDKIWDTKGDLAVATGADTAAKLPVGPDTQVLTADSAQSSGMKWAAAASGALVLLNTVTLGANGIFDVTGIPQTYSDLILVLVARDTAASNIISPVVLVNNDTGANYYNTRLSVVSGSAAPGETLAGSAFGDSRLPGSTAPANSFGFNAFVFPGYASTVWLKTVSWESFTFGGTITGNQHMQRGGGTWNSTAAINRVTVKGNGNGNLVAGSQLRIYGRS